MISLALPLLLILFVPLILIVIMATKAPSTFWQSFGHNLKTFYLYVALFVGLITVLINGVTLVKTFLEETVFLVEYNYVDYYSCENAYYDRGVKPAPVPLPESAPVAVLTDEERKACEERALERGRKDRENEVNRQLASGVAGLFFGLLIWITHFIWIRKTK